MTRLDILIAVVVAGFVVCWLVLRRIEFYAARCLNELEQINVSSDRTSDNTAALSDIVGHLSPNKLDIDPEP